MKSNGLLTSLPFALQFLLCLFGGWMTDWIRNKQWMSTINIRKVNAGLGLIIPAIAIILAGYMGRQVFAIRNIGNLMRTRISTVGKNT